MIDHYKEVVYLSVKDTDTDLSSRHTWEMGGFGMKIFKKV